MTVALACHVFDEAANGFLAVYNPAVVRIREVIPWAPIPTFTFGEWLTGLIIADVVLLAASGWAFQGRRWILFASYAYAALMMMNALGHIAGSIVSRQLMPGVISSPLLLAVAAYLWQAARRTQHGDTQSAVA